MGCCFPRLISPEKALEEGDGHLMLSFVTGGMIILRGNVQQNLPGGTLFITDRKLIHCTQCFGCHRIEFRLNKLKEIESQLSFGSSGCNVTVPCCTSLPDSYLTFKAKIDRKVHTVGVKIKNSDHVLSQIDKLIKKHKIRLSVIAEEEGKDMVKSKRGSTSTSDGEKSKRGSTSYSFVSDGESKPKFKSNSNSGVNDEERKSKRGSNSYSVSSDVEGKTKRESNSNSSVNDGESKSKRESNSYYVSSDVESKTKRESNLNSGVNDGESKFKRGSNSYLAVIDGESKSKRGSTSTSVTIDGEGKTKRNSSNIDEDVMHMEMVS